MREGTITANSTKRGGQTLIIALIIMGVLLIVGFYFAGVLNRNIFQASRSGQRSLAQDLAEAGIRYAHYQLQHSALGADWRPNPELYYDPNVAAVSSDPDLLYLRPATYSSPGNFFGCRADNDSVRDLGGPDCLGPYTRVNFANGRALVRVRYGPGDPNVLLNQPADGPNVDPLQNPVGNFAQPGKARANLIIESIGRPGRISANDPTTIPQTSGVAARSVQYSGFGTDGAEMRNSFAQMRAREVGIATSRRLQALVPLGLTDTSRFITNKDRSTRPADIGIPDELGAVYNGNPVRPPLVMGGEAIPAPGGAAIRGFGSLRSNADVRLHGLNLVSLNRTFGDAWNINGILAGENANAVLSVTRFEGTNALGDVLEVSNNQGFLNGAPVPFRLDSRNPNYTTFGGLLRDGINAVDSDGHPRYVGYLEPPLIDRPDPTSGRTRYFEITRNSGILGPAGNTGRFGHGEGVYVDNSADRQMRSTAEDREDLGTAESLVYDWLNPNNVVVQRSGWDGPFYVPTGAYLTLNADGFTIVRDGQYDSSGRQRTWRRPNGAQTGSQFNRFRIGPGPNGRPYIVNSFTDGIGDINAPTVDYSLGQPFNGVIMFEGNVRVRGVIPTDQQITVVSNATIYIDGSITKGVVDPNSGAVLTRPSRSMLMLMAKDFVAVNPTQFFGVPPGAPRTGRQQDPNPFSPNPLSMGSDVGGLGFVTEMLLDRQALGADGLNPSTWSPFAGGYRSAAPGGGSGDPLNVDLLLSHAADGLTRSNIAMDVNFGLGTRPNYLFPLTVTNAATDILPPNYVTPGYTAQGYAPVYSLGRFASQIAPRFESIGFSMFGFGEVTNVGPNTYQMSTNWPNGQYAFIGQERTNFGIRPTQLGFNPPGQYLLARAALMPHDVRIEASVYAQEGSFFVIPGNWVNWNPNDTRAAWLASGLDNDTRNAIRYQNYGALPSYPFFGEPVDVRITLLGSVSENLPPPMSQQTEWLKKWGWIPGVLGATGRIIPAQHVPAGYDLFAFGYAPNLYITYDPALATARAVGFGDDANNPYIRTDAFGRALPPLPRLPVSPSLTYFGEVNP